MVSTILSKVVSPITGNIPETIPSVTEKASFSGDNPSLGTSRKGIRILCLMVSTIFKAANYKINFVWESTIQTSDANILNDKIVVQGNYVKFLII
jgi:hypothetical protein